MNTEKVQETVEFLESSQATHRKWAEYFETYPEEEKKYLATGVWESAAQHRELERKYGDAIDVVRRLGGLRT